VSFLDDTGGSIGDFWHNGTNAGGNIVGIEDLVHTVFICQRHTICIVDFPYRQAFAVPAK
jgi:hypothetical protein